MGANTIDRDYEAINERKVRKEKSTTRIFTNSFDLMNRFPPVIRPIDKLPPLNVNII